MQKRQWIAVIGCLVLLGGFTGWQTIQLAQAKTQANNLERAIALSSFKAQYGSVLDKVTIQEVRSADGYVIYWTENVSSKEGKTMLHGSAFIDGTLFDSQQTRDVTDLLKR